MEKEYTLHGNATTDAYYVGYYKLEVDSLHYFNFDRRTYINKIFAKLISEYPEKSLYLATKEYNHNYFNKIIEDGIEPIGKNENNFLITKMLDSGLYFASYHPDELPVAIFLVFDGLVFPIGYSETRKSNDEIISIVHRLDLEVISENYKNRSIFKKIKDFFTYKDDD